MYDSQEFVGDLNKDLIIQLLRRQLEDQAKLIESLMARINELENNQKKNSSNSSKPPSTDMGKVMRTRSLRGTSGKKPGGQTGHTGHTLKSISTPDWVEVCRVEKCSNCGKDISSQEAWGYEARQVFDLPVMRLWVTEHRREIKSCPCCKGVTRGSFPAAVAQPVQYGPQVQKLAVYFSNYQLIPYKRTSQIFEDLLGHRISEGSLVKMTHRIAGKLNGFIGQLKEQLLQQPVLHADETGYYYQGARNWLHVLTTEQHTLYMPHEKRGREAMEAMGVLSGYEGTLIHDFWKAYNDYRCSHGLCNIHHQRDLTFCEEMENSRWAAAMKQLLSDLSEKVSKAKGENKNRLRPNQLSRWSNKYDRLIASGWREHPPPERRTAKRGAIKKSKTQNMIKRFADYKEWVLAFAHDFCVPYGNNLAEQAIRMMKVKQKISGCFRSKSGAQDFATIRSYISTTQKQGIPILKALECAIAGNPLAPQA
ncbi:MAG: IS66 family transposase [Bacteroidota bacterium]|nr:IS66 family transposase [Bacteroidota bacterium]